MRQGNKPHDGPSLSRRRLPCQDALQSLLVLLEFVLLEAHFGCALVAQEHNWSAESGIHKVQPQIILSRLYKSYMLARCRPVCSLSICWRSRLYLAHSIAAGGRWSCADGRRYRIGASSTSCRPEVQVARSAAICWALRFGSMNTCTRS